MKKNYKVFRMMLMLALVLCTSMAYAQDRTISGKITDSSDGSGLPGVNILAKGTTAGTVTDVEGNYSLSVPDNTETLVISSVGYLSEEVDIAGKSVINLALFADVKTLEELVVVGYGTQRKNEITGAVSTVTSDDIVSLPVINVEQVLQGRAAGVTIVNNGSPGTAPTVRIRGVGTLGNNAPAFVVDGVVVNDINGLSPEDIESITVLKDASTAAVYGSLGANGVIVVKTKSGENGKVAFNFNAYRGTQSKPKSLTLLNSSQYVNYVTDMIKNADPAADLPARFSDATFINNNTDYQDAIFQTGVTQNYQLSASGGNENAIFRLSGGYQNQDGILLNTALDKYTFRLNSEFNKGRFTFGETMSMTYIEQDPLVLANSLSPIESAFRIAPYLPILDSDRVGGYSELTDDDANSARNPVRNLNRETQKNKNLNIIGNLYAKVKLAEGLAFKTSVGMNYFDNRFKKVELPFGGGGGYNQSETRISYTDVRVKTTTVINSLRYKTTLNEKHNIEALLLAEQQKRVIASLNGVGTTTFGINDISAGLSGGAGEINYNKIGYLGRVNYDYAGKYILAVSLRRDGSSRFGPNNRFGNFYSFAGGWVLSQEDFFPKNSAISYLKLRGSWGSVGNDKIGDYAFSSTLVANYFYGSASGLAIKSLSNSDLKWEEVTMTNIGVDLGFFDDKIVFNAEYYSNVSNDLLVTLPPAASVGVPNGTPTNIGGMTTKGVELNLGVQNLSKGDFQWSANFNLSTTKNEVTKLAENVEQIFNGSKPNVLASNQISRITEGEALWHFYGWQTDGIFQTQAEIDAAATQTGAAPGDIRFKDINGRDANGNLTGAPDGVIDEDDKAVIGDPFPNITYGLSLNGSYKGLDVTVLFTGVSGNDIFNASRYYLDGAAQIGNASTTVLNRWTTSNPSNTQPRAILGDPNKNSRVSDRYVEDGSYLRLKNFSVGYSLSPTLLSSIGGGAMNKLRLYISAQNLFTLTDYSGFDPEIGSTPGISSTTGDANSELGVDRGQYPLSQSFVAGIQIGF